MDHSARRMYRISFGVAVGVAGLYLLLWLGPALLGFRLLPSGLLPGTISGAPTRGPEITVFRGAESDQEWEIEAWVKDTDSPEPAEVCTELRSGDTVLSGQCGYTLYHGSRRYAHSSGELPGTDRKVLYGPVPRATVTVLISFADGDTQQVSTTEINGLPGRFFHAIASTAASHGAKVRILDAKGADVEL